jgi:hypothetical protein
MSALWTLSTTAAVDPLTSRLLHSSSPDCMDLRHKSMRNFDGMPDEDLERFQTVGGTVGYV